MWQLQLTSAETNSALRPENTGDTHCLFSSIRRSQSIRLYELGANLLLFTFHVSLFTALKQQKPPTRFHSDIQRLFMFSKSRLPLSLLDRNMWRRKANDMARQVQGRSGLFRSMEQWSTRALEYWSNGALEYWSNGVMEKPCGKRTPFLHFHTPSIPPPTSPSRF